MVEQLPRVSTLLGSSKAHNLWWLVSSKDGVTVPKLIKETMFMLGIDPSRLLPLAHRTVYRSAVVLLPETPVCGVGTLQTPNPSTHAVGCKARSSPVLYSMVEIPGNACQCLGPSRKDL